MKGKHFKKFGKKILKRVTSALLVVVMLFTMMGIYIPAETFKAAGSGVTVTIHFAKPTYMDASQMNLYVWGTEGGEVASWPGLQMTANAENTASFTSGGETCNWYTVTIQNYSKKGLNCITYGMQGNDVKKSYDTELVSGDLTQDYECWLTMGEWSESTEDYNNQKLYKYELVVSTNSPDGWTKTEVDNTEYNYTLYVADIVEDKWDDADSKVHAWTVGEEGTALTLEETNETWKGGKWRKAEFTGKANVGFILAEKNWGWQTGNMLHVNEAKADQTLYLVNGTIYTDINSVPDLSVDHYAFVEYGGGDAPYGASVFAWGTGYSNIGANGDEGFFVPFRLTEDGTYVAKVPVKDNNGADMKFGFLVNSAPYFKDGETQKYSGDLYHTIDGSVGYSKVVFSKETGTIVKEYGPIKSSEINRKDNIITFYYRDNDAFAKTGVGNLGQDVEVKAHVITKTETGTSQVVEHAMEYSAAIGAYKCEVPLTGDAEYYYYFSADDTEVTDGNATKEELLEGQRYSYIRNKVYHVTVEANLYQDPQGASDLMDYDQNKVISITYGPETENDSLEGFKLEHIYLDLSELGLGSRVEINREYVQSRSDRRSFEYTFGCSDTATPGEKTVTVTLVDDCGMEYTDTVEVTVVERDKTDDFDWDEAIIYFTVTDRFYDGDSDNNTVTDDGSQTTGYNTSNKLGIHGGDFAGLEEKLDYIQGLGVNTIWITPIVDNVDHGVDPENTNNTSFAHHGYWAEDFTILNPHLGTEDEFRTLIEAIHERGMKIMVDVVLNHSGYGTENDKNFQYDTGYKDAGGNAVYDDMFRNESIEGDDEKRTLDGLPDFETENPEVRALLIEWQTAWMSNYNIDYYRVDTVKHVDEATWVEFKNALVKINSRFKLIGEYYDAGYRDDFDQLSAGTMDSILDFHFNDVLKNISKEDLNAIEDALQYRNAILNNTATMGSFLSSHDENGFLYDLIQAEKNGSEDWARKQMMLAVTYQMTAKGQPVIYYGEEIGQTGIYDYPNLANRYDFDWTTAENGNAMLTHYEKMIAIRNEYTEIFAKGDRYSVIISEVQPEKYGVVENQGYSVFARSYNNKTVYVGTNVFADAKTVKIYVQGEAGDIYVDEYSGNKYTVSSEGSITVSIPGLENGGTVVLAREDKAPVKVNDTEEVTVVIHYNREDNNYTDWNAWLWSDNLGGAQYNFEKNANGEMVTSVTVDGLSSRTVNFRIRKGEWKESDHGGQDQAIDISDIVSGTVHYYIESGDWGGTRVLGCDAILGNKIVNTGYDKIMNTFTITTTRPLTCDLLKAFQIVCTSTGKAITIKDVTANDCAYTIEVKEDLTAMAELLKSYQLTFEGKQYTLTMPNIYSSKAFEDAYTYKEDDLGLTYTKNKSTFKVWAPTAKSMRLNIYASGTKGTNDLIESYEMTLGDYGVWTYELEGDWNGKYYTYTVDVNNKVNEVCDPYARTTGVNGHRAMILDLDTTDPDGWAEDKNKKLHDDMAYTDAVIYELHVRDLSSDDSSGISDANQGKFLGLTETGTKTPGGQLTGLDHMIDLGVTHVHLLPVYDYASVDETGAKGQQFNWGYDPQNYNVPEGSYSTNPYEGQYRVKEMKQMVQALHDNNINVIMDVVYNHVHDAGTFGFNQLVPDYFSRTNADGSYSNASGCGNDTASERSMVHKYIVESILYWHEEYHIDGFRFDLVGLLDTETINDIVTSVHAIDKDIIFYGEGWTMYPTLSKDNVHLADQGNAWRTPGFAYFSDTLRDNLAGNNTSGQGFIWVNGNADTMKALFAGNAGWCPEPTQTVNYASCHDNYTLMDKINEASNAPYDSYDDAPGTLQVKLNNLSAAYYMFAQGIPFIHAGEEFLRTKLDEQGQVIHNSYNSSDFVNSLRWYNLDGTEGNYALYADTVDYYEGLIEFRKNHEALRLTTDAKISEVLTSYSYDNYLLAYKLDGTKVEGEVADEIIIIYNASNDAKDVNIKENLGASDGTWTICVNDKDAGTKSLGTVNVNANASWPTVAAHSVLVLVKGETVDTDSVYTRNNNVTITLDQPTLALKEGTTAELTATVNPANSTLIWTSSNKNVATVENGVITAVAPGTTTITVSTLHGVTATCTVTVMEKQRVTLDKASVALKEGATTTLTATATPSGTTVTWGVKDDTIATVVNGVVTAVRPGTTTVYVETPEGAKAECTVTVLEKEDVELEESVITLKEGTNTILSVIASDEAVLTWKSDDDTIASVDQTGKVIALKAGEATITVTTQDGLFATCVVTVTHDLVRIDEKEETCTTDGNIKHYECSVCHDLFKDEAGTQPTTRDEVTIPALGHVLTLVPAKEATCTEAGNHAYYTCSHCEDIFTDATGTQTTTLEAVTIGVKAHSLVAVEAKDPTNTEAGNKAHYECSVCHDLFKDEAGTQPTTEQEVTIPALGHVLTLVPAKEATCTEAGNHAYYTCSHCEDIFTDATGTQTTTLEAVTIGVKAHSLVAVEAKDPTNTEAGNKAHYECSVCHDLFKDEAGTQPTTEQEVTIPALGHVLTLVPAKEATCTEAGNHAYYTCSHCEDIFADATGTQEFEGTTVIPATGHDLTKVEAKAPTIETTGNKEYYVCGNCDKLFLDEECIQETTLEDVTIDKLQPEVPPVNPEQPELEKEDVVYVPEEEIHEQVKGEATGLVDKITDSETTTDVVEEGIISEETLDKVQQAIEDEEEIITELVIENKKHDDVEETAKELVESTLNKVMEGTESIIAQYLDIKIVLKTEESNEELGTLNKLSEEITLTFEIPDEWKKEGRKFHVIRVHEGKTDVLDVWENEDGSVSFKTDRFSTYALVYTDADTEDEIVPTPPTTPEEPTKPSVPTAPQTGDNSMPGVYFLVLLAGFAVAMAGVANKRKYVK